RKALNKVVDLTFGEAVSACVPAFSFDKFLGSDFSLFVLAEKIVRMFLGSVKEATRFDNFFDDVFLLGPSIDKAHNPAAVVPPWFLSLVAPRRLSLRFLSCSGKQAFTRCRSVPLMSEQSGEVEVNGGGQVRHRLDLARTPIVDFVIVGHRHAPLP